jgi:hypothetical protein
MVRYSNYTTKPSLGRDIGLLYKIAKYQQDLQIILLKTKCSRPQDIVKDTVTEFAVIGCLLQIGVLLFTISS